MNDTAYGPTVSESIEKVVLLTVILLSPLIVDIGEVCSRKIKYIANNRLWLWPRGIGSLVLPQHYILPE